MPETSGDGLQPTSSRRRQLLAGGSWVLGGKTLTVLSTLAINWLLGHSLTPQEFAVYVQAFSLVTICGILAQVGVQQAIVRLVAASLGLSQPGRARRAVGMVYRTALLGAAAVALLLVLGPGAALVRGPFDSPKLAASMGALALWAAAMSLQVLTSETFRGFQDLRLAALFGGVVTGVLTVALLLLQLRVGGGLVIERVLTISVVATSLSLAFGLLLVWRKAAALPKEGALSHGELFDIALPLWVSGVTNVVLVHSDIWIISAFRPQEEVAVYGAAARMVVLVSQPLILVNLLVPPFIAELYARGEKQRLQRLLRGTATCAGLPALLVLLAFVLFGGPILGVVYGDFYSTGATVLTILSVAKLVNVLTGSCGVTMSMTGHQHLLMRISVVTGGAAVLGAYLAVERFGPVGVATAIATGAILQNLLLWLATRYYAGLWTHPSIPSVNELRDLLNSVRGSPGRDA